ncbi:MAG TPA: type I-E CRISPR-associated protein Cse1/CasA [Anaeromyxobacter sp.]|nr:type I-E CRISPR-associated protein Cse1/CasA [Anaeromyxobacter sp.]
MKPTFDLVNEAWIPCVDHTGRRVEVGLAEALGRAHEYREVRDESPLATAALVRLMLAVLYSALEGPKDIRGWKVLWAKGELDRRKVEKYLDAWRHRFDLFDEKHPFFQVGGFEIPGKEPTPVSKLTHEIATGNAATLFDHSVEERVRSVPPSVAARWLVTAQSFAVGGGVGATSNRFGKHPNFTHAPMVGGAAIFSIGASLFETLLLNLTPFDTSPGRRDADRPVWEHDRLDSPRERPPRGPLDFLTWRSRMVRLLPDPQGSGTAVTSMFFASGLQCPREFDNRFWGYVVDEVKGKLPIGFRSDRALWRDSTALLAAGDGPGHQRRIRPACVSLATELVEREILPRDSPLRVLSLGMANDKAKVLFWRREEWSVPPRVLEDPGCANDLDIALQRAESCGKALYASMSHLGEVFRDGVPGARTRAMRSFWGGLELAFRSLLARLGAKDVRAVPDWTEAVKRSAWAAFHEHSENVQRRSARELRARVQGAGLLDWKLRELTTTDEKETADA